MACGVPQKCSARFAWLVRIYIIALSLPVLAAAVWAAVRIGTAAALLPTALAAVMLWAVLILPEQYAASAQFVRHRDWLLIERGLLWRRQILIPRRQIQYVRLCQGPLYRLLRLYTLCFMTPGGRVYLRGLDREQAEHLRSLLERGLAG